MNVLIGVLPEKLFTLNVHPRGPRTPYVVPYILFYPLPALAAT